MLQSCISFLFICNYIINSSEVFFRMIKRIQKLTCKIIKNPYFTNKQYNNRYSSHIISRMSLFQNYFSNFSNIKATNSSFTNGQNIVVDFHQYQFCLLEQREIDKALKLTIDILVKEGPLNKVRFEKDWSQVSPQKMKKYSDFVETYLQNSVRRRLAQGIFYNRELIGVSVSQDLSYTPANFSKIYYQAYDLLKYDMAVLDQLFVKTPSIIKSLMGVKNQLIDMGNTVIKQEHRGKGLLKNLINQIQKTAIRQKFKFIFVCSTNCKISATLQKRGYSKICDVDVKEIEVDKEKPFEKIDEDNRWPGFWLKDIDGKCNQE